ncbi:hypothetical protein CLV84_2133 [Neolewinella xylanilytica]|uniref:Uncharacterized protein n=1 Tax=Neolewinella xylanilytica TaxID=1514080 RepID=A0A2S6I2D1_9BACT|nr:hypothetical protein [Neolewinella xylanilytica]PPK85241.1 hypothetical protein CLV84_2133 [Neolewinella xylanilytica]
MKQLLSISFVALLLLQAGSEAVMIQWQQHARESFAELFCVNRALEDIPMCYGSCQMPDLYAGLTDDTGKDELAPGASSPAQSVYLPVRLTVLPARPMPPAPSRLVRPRTEPVLQGGDHRRASLQPPLA